jgi:hypothetical protein
MKLHGCHDDPKRHFVRQNRVIGGMTCRNRLICSTCAHNEENFLLNNKKINKCCNFTMLADENLRAITMNLISSRYLTEVIKRAKYDPGHF